MPIHDDSTIARFWRKVDIRGPNECWAWLAGRNRKGYGVVSAKPGQSRLSHVRSFLISVGATGGFFVLHKCDNPRCVNPKHLFLGTNRDNMEDMREKGRSRRGSKHHNAKLQEESVLEIRQLLNSGRTGASVAAQYGVSVMTISFIKTRRRWGWLP